MPSSTMQWCEAILQTNSTHITTFQHSLLVVTLLQVTFVLSSTLQPYFLTISLTTCRWPLQAASSSALFSFCFCVGRVQWCILSDSRHCSVSSHHPSLWETCCTCQLAVPPPPCAHMLHWHGLQFYHPERGVREHSEGACSDSQPKSLQCSIRTYIHTYISDCDVITFTSAFWCTVPW